MTEKSYAEQDLQAVVSQYLAIRERVENACVRAGRRVEEVTLVGVTKTVEAPLINAALDAGLTAIGENRVQEYLSKKDDLHLDGVARYLIGHLQTNKVRAVVGEVDMIQSVDSLRLAAAIDRVSAEKGIITPVLVEVNIGDEVSKDGISADNAQELLCQMADFSHISVQGLMTIPPISDTEAKKRYYFSKMHQLFIDIQSKKIDNISMNVLSMGMSDDFEEAIAEGSTMVRVGTAIFGRRFYPV
ncbi:MAG: YggS family pyridoxal phosphate-dependent enzyme [Ruminococcaceae bacterium]|nr:YggS family pyridoxal phosphate-dependent enzyme [Oscillospiraceae bacterium]